MTPPVSLNFEDFPHTVTGEGAPESSPKPENAYPITETPENIHFPQREERLLDKSTPTNDFSQESQTPEEKYPSQISRLTKGLFKSHGERIHPSRLKQFLVIEGDHKDLFNKIRDLTHQKNPTADLPVKVDIHYNRPILITEPDFVISKSEVLGQETPVTNKISSIVATPDGIYMVSIEAEDVIPSLEAREFAMYRLSNSGFVMDIILKNPHIPDPISTYNYTPRDAAHHTVDTFHNVHPNPREANDLKFRFKTKALLLENDPTGREILTNALTRLTATVPEPIKRKSSELIAAVQI